MALDTLGMGNLFPNSVADGDGYNSNIQQRRRNEGSLDADRITLMYSGAGEITSAVEIDIDSYTFQVKDFLPKDGCKITIMIVDASSVGAGTIKIRAIDSMGSSDGARIVDTTAITHAQIFLTQKLNSNVNITAYGWRSNSAGIFNVKDTYGLTDENIISTAWTITLRGNVNTAGTLYYAWWVYRIGHIT